MRRYPFRSTLCLGLFALAGAPAMADVPLPLRHGTYIMEGNPCNADAAFAIMRSFDGAGFGDPHLHGCHARLLSRKGSTVVLDNSCIDVGVGPGLRGSERLTVRVESPTRYVVIDKDGSTGFNYCAAAGQ